MKELKPYRANDAKCHHYGNEDQRGTGAHDDRRTDKSTLVMTDSRFHHDALCLGHRKGSAPRSHVGNCGLEIRAMSIGTQPACDRAGTKSPEALLLCYRPLMALELRMMGDPR